MRSFVAAAVLLFTSSVLMAAPDAAARARFGARVLATEVAIAEGNAGKTPVSITIMRLPGQGNNFPNPGTYRTVDGSATAADNDYVPIPLMNYVIPAGQDSITIEVDVVGDLRVEGDETFTVEITNVQGGPVNITILNDDAPAVTVPDARVNEGNSGTTQLVFTVALTAAATVPVQATYRTSDGTATAGVDYQSASGTLNFAPGTTQQTVAVTVNGDTAFEPDETFTLTVAPAVGTLAGPVVTATGTIANDDAPTPTVLRTVSGNGQRGTLGQPLPQPLVVEVLNSAGAPAAGVAVQWTVLKGSAQLSPTTSTTNAQGHASTTVTVTGLGPVTIQASVGQLLLVTFDVSATTALAARAEGPVAIPIARALDQACASPQNEGTLSDACRALSQLPDGELSRALERVAPQESGAQAKVATSVVAAVAGGIGSRLAALRSGTERFSIQHLSLNFGGRSIPIGALAHALFQAAQTTPAGAAGDEEKDYNGWSAFLSGNLGSGKRIAHDGELGFDLDTRGLMLGVDRQVGRGVLGLSANVMQLDSTLTENNGSVDTTGYALSLYGSRPGLFAGNAPPSAGKGMHYDGVHVDGSVTLGRNRYDSKHVVDIPTLSLSTARSRNDASVFAVAGVTGVEAHNGRTDFDLTLSGTWSRADVDDLTESGDGPLILFVQGHEVESTVGMLGFNVRSAFDTPFGSVLPSLRAELHHEFQSGARLVTARFLRDRLNTAFTIPIDQPDTNYGKLAAGLQAVFAHGVSAQIDLTQDVLRSDLHYRVVQFNVSKSF